MLNRRTYYYSAEVCRDVNDPTVYVARLVSRAEGLDKIIVGTGKTPDTADQALRALLKEALGREPFPINRRIVPGCYFCLPCTLLLPTRDMAIEHRRSKHGSITTLLP